MEHKAHPYPDEAEKKMLCEQTDLTMNQISNWMINVCRTCEASVIPSLVLMFFVGATTHPHSSKEEKEIFRDVR